MTEKRFVDYFDKEHNYIIQDLQNEDEYQVGFVNCDEDVFLELINQLSNENEQLKQTIETQNFNYGNAKSIIHDSENQIRNLKKENEQLKTTISRLIEQNRKNNDLLLSDIRLLEKALWCPNCTINIKRLRELKNEFEK